ncbi:MAG: hypothetical protein CBC04_00325 [Verrucomicrobia bacterium TMED44]|nr:MAG: hypothetical protein CBC04_00325 [Verrucomicrobia bacterium TMED44]
MVMLIAEIGVNHNGCPELLEKLINEAKDSGADACKFQTFKADKLAKKSTPKVRYQLATSDPEESHWKMLKNLELSDEMHHLALNQCKSLGLEFISTPYDPDSVQYLFDLGVKTIKTASADVVDHRIHKKVVELGMRPIIAVGMASIDEIRSMLKIYQNAKIPPVLLHCVSNYPCSFESINLSCMTTLKTEFGYEVGLSDHSIDCSAASLAVALGASVIEKHFTLNKDMDGPDHKASSTPQEFKELSEAIAFAKIILGSPIKRLQDEEKQMYSVSRKSVCLKRPLSKGSKIEMSDLTMIRPGTGLNGDDFYNLSGHIVNKDLPEGHQISWDDLFDKDSV